MEDQCSECGYSRQSHKYAHRALGACGEFKEKSLAYEYDEVGDLRKLIQEHVIVVEMQSDEIKRLKDVEDAAKRLAYIVRKSVNSGPLSRDPTQEAEAWRALRMALGERYYEKGNHVPVPKI